MKKLLAGTIIATGLIAVATPSYALFGAGDVVFDPSVFEQALQQVKQGTEWINNQMTEIANQLKGLNFMSDTLDEVGKVYNQAQSMFYAVNHITSIGGALSALNVIGIRNPLPINPQSVISMANGTGSVTGFIGSVPGLFRSNYDSNHVYDSTGLGYQATALQQRATANAGMQAVAGQIYESMGTRLDKLEDLNNQIDSAEDTKTLQAIQARIAVQQIAVQAQQTQAQAIAIMQTAGNRAIDQRAMETSQQNIDKVIAEGGWDS